MIPCEPSRLYLLCNWQAASLSSAYRAGKTDREAERWMDGWIKREEDTLSLVCAWLGSHSMQLFAWPKYVFQGNINIMGFQ